ncbi:Fatty acid-binding protein, liver [Larimichthys crocea]|uniref:Uncharacterized protein n=1 Tax=Larimichthys crocea TaxID=215358 RepID=A0ACD3QTP2_LARCR|nr:Fatty acid-binding protein, liver [Larimichthys crocea]
MDFNGTWQVYAQENYEEFLKAMELPADVIKMAKDIKPITEIKQTGNDFVVTSKTPGKTVTNSFTVGKEADITTMDWQEDQVHCQSGGRQTGLQNWQVLPHPRAQGRRDGRDFNHGLNNSRQEEQKDVTLAVKKPMSI